MAWKCVEQYQWGIRIKVHKKKLPKWFMGIDRLINRPLSRRSTKICTNHASLGLNTILPTISIWLSFTNFSCDSFLDSSFAYLILYMFALFNNNFISKMSKNDQGKYKNHARYRKNITLTRATQREISKCSYNDCADSKYLDSATAKPFLRFILFLCLPVFTLHLLIFPITC